jgi:uncharacterized protein YceH (UPF0502 family)
MYDFGNLEEVQQTVDQLQQADTPFVEYLPKVTGQKEARLVHRFADIPSAEELEKQVHAASSPGHVIDLEARLEIVERELSEL